ncbi:MAG: hypothetical protein HOP31_07980 [Ignavibacteria bacterium]|nr:hypothetical protein [Ignavibacteria bacterium]
MITSKAIDLVCTFNEAEFKEFGLFVSSPFYNKEAVQVKFYEVMKKYYPSFSGHSFEKEKVFAKLYPGKKYNDGVMRNILSKTLELAESYLTVKRQQSNEFSGRVALMRELSERKMIKLFERSEVKAKEILESSAVKDEQYYYDKFVLIYESRRFLSNKKSALYSSNDMLRESAENLTVSFLISMLRSETNIANSNLRMFKFEKDTALSELEIYAEKEIIKFPEITYLQYYYNAFKLARTQDEKYFYELKSIVYSSYEQFGEQDRRDIFTILTNYCYYKVNKGELNFRKEHFLLYKENIVRGFYKGSRNYLDHIQYLNVVVTGLDAGDSAWVEEFIEKYKAELDDTNRENSYNFSRALVFYNKTRYNDALNMAARVKTDDLSYKHQLKSLYLKIYYDMNETEPFYSHVDSYRHFLLNEKHIPEVTRNVINSYVNYTKKLFDIKNRLGERDYDLFRIRNDISDSKAMVNKSWLLERIDKIEKSLR